MGSPAQTATWLAHPNADGPASMMLGIHAQFRAASHRLMHLLEEPQGQVTIRHVFSQLAQVLHHHHHAEEAMVFPFVHRRTGIAPAQLQTDHDEMTTAIEAVERALTPDGTDVREAITRFHEILVTHLDREEELVIPILLQLRPHELWAQLHE